MTLSQRAQIAALEKTGIPITQLVKLVVSIKVASQMHEKEIRQIARALGALFYKTPLTVST